MIEIIDVEAHPDLCWPEVGRRETRETLPVGILVRLVLTDGKRKDRAWLKIKSATKKDGTTVYVGEVVDDLKVDLERGEELTFGPEHVCEWDVPMPPPRTRARRTA